MFEDFKVLKSAVFVLCVLSFITCTKDLQIDFASDSPDLVINSLFKVGDVFRVKLSTTRNILDGSSENEIVSDAYVAIKDAQGLVLEVLDEKNRKGVYWSSDNLKAFPGDSYILEVTHPKWKGVVFTASTTVPELGTESILDTNVVLISDAPALKVGATIDDIQREENKYIFEVELSRNNELSPLIAFDAELKAYGDQSRPKRLFIQDTDFNGQKKDLHFVSATGLPIDSSNSDESVVIRMLSVSDEYYQYYKSLEEYNVAQNSIGSINTSAVKIYSNIKQSGVEKGFGIFAAYNSKELKIDY